MDGEDVTPQLVLVIEPPSPAEAASLAPASQSCPLVVRSTAALDDAVCHAEH